MNSLSYPVAVLGVHLEEVGTHEGEDGHTEQNIENSEQKNFWTSKDDKDRNKGKRKRKKGHAI